MGVQLALQDRIARFTPRLKLPDALPPFGDTTYRIYRVIWYIAVALAFLGPAAGMYARFASPADNSGLMLGSRAGFVISEDDATRIRYPLGPDSAKLGLRAGDDIIAVEGLKLPNVVRFSEADRAAHPDVPAYMLLAHLYGSDQADVGLTVRSVDGKTRNVIVTTGEQHIDNAVTGLGIPSTFLIFIDLLHVVTYPFLLLAAWFLHKRQPRDPVSCALSLAILLTMATEQPAATFLELAGIPRPIHVALYDLGNILLLGGILLFPHGKLSPRLLALLAALPALLFLHGDAYRALFMFFMLCSVMMLINCHKKMPPGEVRQQIKWALFGFSGYAFFLATSLICDMVKPQAWSFVTQLLLETAAGLSLGLAFLAIQMGLLVALIRYRLYDAQFVISSSATLGLVTLLIGALFAGGTQGLGDTIKSIFGEDAGAGAAGVGAAMATVLINPAHDRIHKWMEKRFHKNLLELRTGLPENVRDLREVAPLPELLHEIMHRVRAGVQATRAAIIIDGKVEEVSDVSREEAALWYAGFAGSEEKRLCDGADDMFRVRVPLTAHGQLTVGWLLIGPRPDGTSLRDDEQDTLVEVADPIARAIRIVIKRDKEEQELHGFIDELRHRLDALEGDIIGPRLKAHG